MLHIQYQSSWMIPFHISQWVLGQSPGSFYQLYHEVTTKVMDSAKTVLLLLVFERKYDKIINGTNS